MDESITKEISIEGVSSRDLFGTHGAYLERMAALSPRVKIVARGDTVKVLGSKADVEAFERKMRGVPSGQRSLSPSRTIVFAKIRSALP